MVYGIWRIGHLTKKVSVSAVCILLAAILAGCSMPAKDIQGSLHSFTKEEKGKKGFFGEKRSVKISDVRGSEIYEEDIEGLKEEAEEYISQHPGLTDAVKSDLRELKISQGATIQEVTLLLGEPDKAAKLSGGNPYGAQEVWIYKHSKIRAFTVFIFPIFFVHEAYYLFFKDGKLAGIERRYLRQVIQQGGGEGLPQKK